MKKYEQSKAVMVANPCSVSCGKCGSSDVSRTHHYSGETFSRGIGDHKDRKDDRVEYGMRYGYVKKECIVHHCRVCGFEWSTGVLDDMSKRPIVDSGLIERAHKELAKWCEAEWCGAHGDKPSCADCETGKLLKETEGVV